jgi:hypothetical protein
MKFLSILSLIPSLASAAAIASRTAPAGVKVTSATYGGSGCTQGSLSIGVSEGGDICPIVTRGLLARAGPGYDISDSRRFCQINFGLSYPPGWSFTVLAVEYTGYVNLKDDSEAHVESTYYFSGELGQVRKAL